MSANFHCLLIDRCPAIYQSFLATILFVASLSLLSLSGCDDPEPTGLSGKERGFKVADEEDEGRPESGSDLGQSEPPNPLTDSPIFGDNNSNSSQGNSNEFGKKLLDQLTLSSSADQTELQQFFLDCDKRYRLLFVRFQNQLMTQTDFLTISRELADKRLRAASRLEKIAGDDQEALGLAIRQRLQGLSELVTIGDQQALQSMQLLAEESSQSEIPAVAHIAKVYLTEIELSKIAEQRSSDYSAVVSLYEGVLADKKELKAADFYQGLRVLQMLDSVQQTESVAKVSKQIANAFEDFSDPSIANSAWQMKLQGSEEMNKFVAALESFAPDQTPVSTGDFRKAIREFSNKFTSPRAVVFLAQQLTNVEYSGNVQHARELVGLISERASELKGVEKNSIEELLSFFDKRTGIIGKRVELPDIVDFGQENFDASAMEGKVVLIDFWATWCGPCISEFPNMQRLYEEHNDEGFEIIGICIDDTDAAVTKFIDQRPLPWRIARPAPEAGVGFKSKIAKRYGVGAIPFMILIDRQGIARHVHIRGKNLEGAVKELLAESPTS